MESNWDLLLWNRIGTCSFGIELGPAVWEPSSLSQPPCASPASLNLSLSFTPPLANRTHPRLSRVALRPRKDSHRPVSTRFVGGLCVSAICIDSGALAHVICLFRRWMVSHSRFNVPMVPQEEACNYRYLLSVPGYGAVICDSRSPKLPLPTSQTSSGRDPSCHRSLPAAGYSNRLKSLLLCGSVVIHLKANWEEYFTPMLRDREHLVIVTKVEDFIPVVMQLRANVSLAERIGRAGRQFALQHLGLSEALRYWRALLARYSRLMTGRVAISPADQLVASADDVRRVTRQCPCASPGNETAAQDSLARCTARHSAAHGSVQGTVANLQQSSMDRAQHAIAMRCCAGWDCATDVCPGE